MCSIRSEAVKVQLLEDGGADRKETRRAERQGGDQIHVVRSPSILSQSERRLRTLAASESQKIK